MKHPNIDPIKNSHCSYCGSRFTEQSKWPRKCFICWNESYKNPIPVVVMMIEVMNKEHLIFSKTSGSYVYSSGWLIIQRNTEPGKSGWAFPGGYVDAGETYQQACARELKEEVGIVALPEHFIVQDIRNDDTGHMLIFCSYSQVMSTDKIKFIPNDEVSQIAFPTAPDQKELCFSSHNEMWKKMYDYNFT